MILGTRGLVSALHMTVPDLVLRAQIASVAVLVHSPSAPGHITSGLLLCRVGAA